MKFKRYAIYLLSLIMRAVLPIHKGRVLFWATLGKDYGCNPMYISKYLVNNEKFFDVWWMFIKGANIGNLDKKEKFTWYGSFKYLYILNTAEFLITNHRTYPRHFFWKKKHGQKYIMTWHASMALKKVEKDATEAIGKDYVNTAKIDSEICDLMLSDCEIYTGLIRKSFWYYGEILKTSLPRNEKIYDKDNYAFYRNKVLNLFCESIKEEPYIILYAPTFRPNKNIDAYITDWDDVKSFIKSKIGKEVIILMRLHPNLLQEVDTNTLIKDKYIKNASNYNDMQELMVASDLLITDYSSSMFECSMMHKPCILYTPDMEQYNRGFYFDFNELPFSKSLNKQQLIENLGNCLCNSYTNRIYNFVYSYFGFYDQCNGSAKVCEWMKTHSRME